MADIKNHVELFHFLRKQRQEFGGDPGWFCTKRIRGSDTICEAGKAR